GRGRRCWQGNRASATLARKPAGRKLRQQRAASARSRFGRFWVGCWMVDRPRDQTKTALAAEIGRDIDSREVVAYLRAHPDFLDQHPEAVRLLRPPSREIGDGV